jgi:hypothetical protein
VLVYADRRRGTTQAGSFLEEEGKCNPGFTHPVAGIFDI